MRLERPLRQPQGVLGFEYRGKRSPLVFVVAVPVLLVVIAGTVVGAMLFLPQGPRDALPVRVEVSDDRSAVMASLQDAGVLRYPFAFRILSTLRGRALAAGQYTVSPHLSVWSLVRVLTTTKPRQERVIRIIEGWNLRDIGAYLEREGIAQAEELYELVGFPAVDYRSADPAIPRPKDFASDIALFAGSGKPEFVGFEGYLFPDTYRIFVDASLEDIVRKMFGNLDYKLSSALREEIAASGHSLHQLLTMASIIEAEISNHEDRAIAAGILWKRRDNGMLLQVDATVNYVTGKHDPRVSREDATADSLYNTYRYPGLPRGPIGNPGMSAMLAALRPKESPYWFFLTTPDGRTIFSRTLEEHNANVYRYLH